MKDMEQIMKNVFLPGGLNMAGELTALSYPVPALDNGRLTERFFLCSNQARAVRRRPFAWLAMDVESGRLARYADCAVEDFAAGLGAAPDQELDYSAPEGQSVRETQKLARRMSELYRSIRTFAFCPAPSGEQREAMAQYQALLPRVWRPELRRFYEALSPEFFAWLQGARADNEEE